MNNLSQATDYIPDKNARDALSICVCVCTCGGPEGDGVTPCPGGLWGMEESQWECLGLLTAQPVSNHWWICYVLLRPGASWADSVSDGLLIIATSKEHGWCLSMSLWVSECSHDSVRESVSACGQVRSLSAWMGHWCVWFLPVWEFSSWSMGSVKWLRENVVIDF